MNDQSDCMNAQSDWLHRLGTNRPWGAAALTPDILGRTGPPPVPLRDSPPDAAAWFLAVRVIPLLADDNCRRAFLKAKRLRAAAATQADVDDATAEVTFWAHVRDWATTWADEPAERVTLRLVIARIPRQQARFRAG